MTAAMSGLLALLAVGTVWALWTWWRAPRHGKNLTPITDGWDAPIEFRPGPPVMPEHDATSLGGRDAAAQA